MCGECLNAMARIGGQYAAAGVADPGWGHYDACPLAHDEDGECICNELAAEYDEED